MSAHVRFSDPKREYWEIYRKTRARMEMLSEEELRCFLAKFSLVKRFWMRVFYHPDALGYKVAKDILRVKNGYFIS